MHTRSLSGIMPMGKVRARRSSLGRMRRTEGTIPYTIDQKEEPENDRPSQLCREPLRQPGEWQ